MGKPIIVVVPGVYAAAATGWRAEMHVVEPEERLTIAEQVQQDIDVVNGRPFKVTDVFRFKEYLVNTGMSDRAAHLRALALASVEVEWPEFDKENELGLVDWNVIDKELGIKQGE